MRVKYDIGKFNSYITVLKFYHQTFLTGILCEEKETVWEFRENLKWIKLDGGTTELRFDKSLIRQVKVRIIFAMGCVFI